MNTEAPNPHSLSRAIIATRDLALDLPRMQHLAMFYEKILVWPAQQQELQPEHLRQVEDELAFLAQEGVVMRCGIKVPDLISFQRDDGTSWRPFDSFSQNCELVFDMSVVQYREQMFPGDKSPQAIVRAISSVLAYESAPVSAHSDFTDLATKAQLDLATQIILKSVPTPPDGMPWQDLIAFRNDPETKSHLRRLRIWLRQRAAESTRTPAEWKDEIEELVHQYRSYMRVQHKKFGETTLSTILVAGADVVKNAAMLNFGEAAKSIFEIRTRRLDLTEAELAAPGRELAFLSKAQEWAR